MLNRLGVSVCSPMEGRVRGFRAARLIPGGKAAKRQKKRIRARFDDDSQNSEQEKEDGGL